MLKPPPPSDVERVFLPIIRKDQISAPEPTVTPSPTPGVTPPPPGTSQRVAIDPITRIEGHLRLEVKVEDGYVTDAWSAGMMFRGIELILPGRDPRDAWVFAQRICGV
jgi:hypothetical protein